MTALNFPSYSRTQGLRLFVQLLLLSDKFKCHKETIRAVNLRLKMESEHKVSKYTCTTILVWAVYYRLGDF